MAGRSIPPEVRERYVNLRVNKGYSRQQAADSVGVHKDTGRLWDARAGLIGMQKRFVPIHDPRHNSGNHSANDAVGQLLEYDEGEVPEPVPLHLLKAEPKRALEDIGYFAERYFGARLLPFHQAIVDTILELQATPWEEFLITNIAPGAGKSMFKRIVAAWMVCRDRTSRGIIGSASRDLAKRDVEALRTAFERTVPQRASLEAKRAGFATDAVACLCMEYGRFKPNSDEGSPWRADGFRVAQIGAAVGDKELTVIAVGFDTKYVGTRTNWSFWDDPHDSADIRTLDGQVKMQEDWENVAEARVETAGLLWVIQQRLGKGDLTQFCKGQTVAYDSEDGEPGEERPVYHHMAFRAHYEDRCQGEHSRDAAPWPEGCLLFPRKLHWRLLQAKMRKANFPVVYQQEDVAPGETLVQKLWVYGGRDPETAEEYPGCVDHDRAAGELPQGLVPPFYSVACVDPSPTNFWALEWWVYVPATQMRYLIDCDTRRMGAGKLIDRLFPSGEFTGFMEEWQVRSTALGAPIQWWIFEQNAAQRFVLQFNHVHDWQALRGAAIIAHDTHRNKSDPKLGVDCIGPHWRYGRVRVPWHQSTKHISMKLIEQVTTYPKGTYDDCVMAEWFLEWNIPRLTVPGVEKVAYQRPAFVRALPKMKVG